jgi:hypothetical protein
MGSGCGGFALKIEHFRTKEGRNGRATILLAVLSNPQPMIILQPLGKTENEVKFSLVLYKLL